MIGLKLQMCQSCDILLLCTRQKYWKYLEENDRMMKKDDVSNIFNFDLLEEW